MSPAKKLIAVVGANGLEGGSVARAILAEGDTSEFAVRALMRDPSSDEAQALAAQGAEVMRIDMDDESSYVRAFEGAHGAFCFTFTDGPDVQLSRAQTMARAAKTARLQHVVWSTMEDTRTLIDAADERFPTVLGKYKIPQFDCKGEADRAFLDLGVPVTMMRTSFYWENLFCTVRPQRCPIGELTVLLPMGDEPLPGIGTEDVGKCTLGLFKQPRDFVGRTVGVASEALTGQEMCAQLGAALGEKVRYAKVTPKFFRSLPWSGPEVARELEFMQAFSAQWCAARDPVQARQLNPSMQTFEQWLASNKARIPIPHREPHSSQPDAAGGHS